MIRSKYRFLGPQNQEEDRVTEIFSNPKNYKLTELLGQGSYGKVYLGITNQGEKFAVKVTSITGLTNREYELILKEAILTRGLDLKRTVKTYGMVPIIIKGQNYLGLVQEYFPGKKLDKYLRHAADELSDRGMLTLMIQTMIAINELHRNKIVHMDIKGDNIIVSGLVVKIIDLGLACRLDGSEVAKLDKCNTVRGASYYIAPEIYARKFDYLYAADIWSYGVTFYQLIYDIYPFEPNEGYRTIGEAEDEIKRLQKLPITYPIVAKFKPCIDVLKYCLQYDYKTRPSSTQVIEYIKQQFFQA